MTREEAIRLIGWLKCTTNREDDLEAIDMAIEALKALPSADAVSKGVLEQFRWERDVAMAQLEEYGIPFGTDKDEDMVRVVRCKDCKYWHSNTEFCGIWSHANFIAQRTLADGYCSRGELKGGDDE